MLSLLFLLLLLVHSGIGILIDIVVRVLLLLYVDFMTLANAPADAWVTFVPWGTLDTSHSWVQGWSIKDILPDVSEQPLCSKELLLLVNHGFKADQSNTSRLFALQLNKNLAIDFQIFSLLELQILHHITTKGLHQSLFDVNMKTIILYFTSKDFSISCAGLYQTTRKRQWFYYLCSATTVSAHQ